MEKVVTEAPWGSLQGVRPSKIAYKMMDDGLSADDIVKIMQAKYGVSLDRAALLSQMAMRQYPVIKSLANNPRKLCIYVGIPFCPSRCSYCSFPSFAPPTERAQVLSFLQAVGQDIQAVVELMSKYGLQANSVYIGGGTPTSLETDDFAYLIETVQKQLVSSNTIEFTVEAGRPDTMNIVKAMAMKRVGVNRISINPQSMRQETLNRIGRFHRVEEVFTAVEMVRSAGIDQLNMDLIAGLPGETSEDVSNSLAKVLALHPENITIHMLSLKRGSRLWELPAEDSEVTADVLRMVDDSRIMLEAAGYLPYYLYRQKNMAVSLENIGYSLPGFECLYNISIIEERQTIVGIGPAAATKAVSIPGKRLESIYYPKDIKTYLATLPTLIQKRNEVLERLFSET